MIKRILDAQLINLFCAHMAHSPLIITLVLLRLNDAMMQFTPIDALMVNAKLIILNVMLLK